MEKAYVDALAKTTKDIPFPSPGEGSLVPAQGTVQVDM